MHPSSTIPTRHRHLLVSYYLTPAGATRGVQFAKLLRYLNEEVLVLAGEFSAEGGHVSPPSVEGVPGVDLVRVPYPVLPTVPRFIRAAFPRIARHTFEFPDEFNPWQKRAYAQIASHPSLPHLDSVVTLSVPPSVHLIGMQLKKTLNLPWIAFMSDLIADNPYSTSRKHHLIRLGLFEKMVVEKADRIILTSEETTAYLRKKYGWVDPRKFVTIEHGYDPEFYGRKPPAGPPWKITFTGQFYGPRSPEPVLKALEYIHRTEPQLLDNLLLNLWTPTPPQISGYDLPEDLVRLHSSVAFDRAIREVEESHACLLIEAPLTHNLTFHSKMADYMGTDLPIIAVTPPGTLHRLVQNAGGFICDPRDPAGIVSILSKAVRAIRTGEFSLTRSQKEFRRKHSYVHVAEQFRAVLAEMGKRHEPLPQTTAPQAQKTY